QKEVERVLATPPGTPLLFRELEPDLTAEPAEAPPLARVRDVLGLEPFDLDVLVLTLAPDIDLRYERLYGYLQDDVTRRRPTLDLVARLLRAGAAEGLALSTVLDATSRLAVAGLMARPPDDHGEQSAVLARPLRLEDRV